MSGRIRRDCPNRSMTPIANDEQALWYVMRDLKRANAKEPAYKLLTEKQFNVFTPMQWKLVIRQGKRIREQHPFIQDLLFVHDSRRRLDPVIEDIPTLQYRYVHGRSYCDPMTVPDADMERFIRAVSATDSPVYYLPEEITPKMYNRRIRIVGGILNGYEGTLLTTRGSKVKRLLVELPNLLAVGVEVMPEYIQLL